MTEFQVYMDTLEKYQYVRVIESLDSSIEDYPLYMRADGALLM